MEDVVDPHAALDEVAHQRNKLADRVRVPGWYVALVVVLAVAFCFARFWRSIESTPHSAYFMMAILFTAIMAFTQWPFVVRVVTGTRLPTNFRRAYPSARRPFYIMTGFYVLGIVVGDLTKDVQAWTIPIGLGSRSPWRP
jgi:hypothetical protein